MGNNRFPGHGALMGSSGLRGDSGAAGRVAPAFSRTLVDSEGRVVGTWSADGASLLDEAGKVVASLRPRDPDQANEEDGDGDGDAMVDGMGRVVGVKGPNGTLLDPTTGTVKWRPYGSQDQLDSRGRALERLTPRQERCVGQRSLFFWCLLGLSCTVVRSLGLCLGSVWALFGLPWALKLFSDDRTDWSSSRSMSVDSWLD